MQQQQHKSLLPAIALGLLLAAAIVSFHALTKKPRPNTSASASNNMRPLSPLSPQTAQDAFWRLNKGLFAEGYSLSMPSKPQSSSKFNAMFLKHGPHLQTPSFTIRVEEGSQIWIGWVRPSKFAEGWAIKALLYGGNLSDGSSLLRSDFGPWLKAGDVVSTRAVMAGENMLRIEFVVNGVDLGVGFEITNAEQVGELFPMVAFTDTPGRVLVMEGESDVLPPPLPHAQENKMVGKWEALASAKPYTLQIEEEEETGALRLVFKVVNVIRVMIVRDGERWRPAGPAMSTMMLPHGEYLQIEAQVNAMCNGLENIRVEDSGEPVLLELRSETGDLLYFRPMSAEATRVKPVTRAELARVLE